MTDSGRHPASKHEAVFRAAKAVFITAGYDGASMDEVARVAGVTKATVYAHAGSKAELFAATVREAIALSASRLELPDAAPGPAEALRFFLARFVEISCWNGSVGLQRTVLATLDRFPGHGPLIVGEVVERAVAILADWLDARAIPLPAENARRLLDAGTASRRFATLMGVEPALPDPPVAGRLQPGAMDRRIEAEVARFCREFGL